MPRKPAKKSLKKANLEPAELAFLLDDSTYCRDTVPRDMAGLDSLREGGRILLFGEMSKTARELLELYGEEALAIYEQLNRGEKPSWFPMYQELSTG